MRLNDAILKMMDVRGYSKSDMSVKVGMSKQGFGRMVNHQGNAQVSTLLACADAADYRLVLVPSTKRLPDGSIEIEGE